mmetsp:Transcript_22823/g.56566  ORF Transcript_22823/g.56566 Transcript_22823/m.56566 type:complete len:223 (+) Transcript_22823:1218-1886(+)
MLVRHVRVYRWQNESGPQGIRSSRNVRVVCLRLLLMCCWLRMVLLKSRGGKTGNPLGCRCCKQGWIQQKLMSSQPSCQPSHCICLSLLRCKLRSTRNRNQERIGSRCSGASSKRRRCSCRSGCCTGGKLLGLYKNIRMWCSCRRSRLYVLQLSNWDRCRYGSAMGRRLRLLLAVRCDRMRSYGCGINAIIGVCYSWSWSSSKPRSTRGSSQYISCCQSCGCR